MVGGREEDGVMVRAGRGCLESERKGRERRGGRKDGERELIQLFAFYAHALHSYTRTLHSFIHSSHASTRTCSPHNITHHMLHRRVTRDFEQSMCMYMMWTHLY